jgi:hypothetical protein
MRMFIRGVMNALDREFRFRCTGGSIGPDNGDFLRKINTLTYTFKNFDDNLPILTLSVEAPFTDTCPIIDGVKIIVKEFGKTYGKWEMPPLKRCLRDKGRFSFVGTDFEYIQYIASALASSESYGGPFRALLVTREEYFGDAELPIPQDARRDAEGRIVLWDTEDLYAKPAKPSP